MRMVRTLVRSAMVIHAVVAAVTLTRASRKSSTEVVSSFCAGDFCFIAAPPYCASRP